MSDVTKDEAEKRFQALVRHAPDMNAIHPDDLAAVAAAFGRAAAEAGRPVAVEFRSVATDGSYRCLEATITNLFDVPAVHAMVINARDVTERTAAAAALLHQSLHDALTDLPNRVLFLDRVTQALRRARRRQTGVAVLCVDLDNFAAVNHAFGHEAGDEVLVAVAGLLEGCLRDTDTVARLGGDEFVICCEDVADAQHVVRLAERLSDVFAMPFGSNGRDLVISASMGIALSGRDGPETADSLLRDAGAAMYQAKQRGRNRWELFDQAARARTAARADVAAALRRAVDDGEITVHYQPVLSLTSGSVVGLEALARWRRDDRMVPPSEFIAVAEESGLIVPLGEHVLETACRGTAAWNAANPGAPLSVAVNLSVHQFGPALTGTVEAALTRSGLDPALLCLEITESALMEDADAMGAALEDLKRLGVQLGVDDFGTGYSSLLYLRRFPIDILKIDRSFVEGMANGDADAAIVEGVIGLAHALRLEAIAEGVETEEQEARLRALGCELAQGYRWAAPMDLDALRCWLEKVGEGARLAG